MIAQKAGINMPVTYYWVFQELYRMDTRRDGSGGHSTKCAAVGPDGQLRQDTGTLCEMFVDARGRRQ